MNHRNRAILALHKYTIALFCPMGVELAPLEAMLDEIHDNLPLNHTPNAYTLGRIGEHHVVLAIMPEIGNDTAATVVTQLQNDFPAVSIGLLVGVGGGVPGQADVRLGDVVVSQPSKTSGGVVQYDRGKRLPDGKFQRVGQLNEPPRFLTSYVRKLEAQHRRLGNQLLLYQNQMFEKYPKMRTQYAYPRLERDRLFRSTYRHERGESCDDCDPSQLALRPDRLDNEPHIHHGIRDAISRDQLSKDFGIICVDMEAAGFMNNFPCLVIRGICDYADSHKNKKWQPYAAAMASAYVKELLMTIPPEQVPAIHVSGVDDVQSFELGLHLGGAPEIDANLFIGRSEELKEIHKHLQADNSSQSQRRLVIGGVGGIGKTQLAIGYAKQFYDRYRSIFWLDATSESTLKGSMNHMARRIFGAVSYDRLSKEGQSISKTIQWLSDSRNTSFLLVFDNYDEPDVFDLKKYYPLSFQGSIIVTSRLPDSVSGHRLYVSQLTSTEERVQILASRSQRNITVQDVHACRLADRLGGVPLALASVGAYLRRSNWTLQEYCQQYEARWDVDPRRPVKLEEYRDRTLYTTWDISYERLRKNDADAARLLELLAYFGHQHISYRLLGSTDKRCPEWFLTANADEIVFESLMNVLVEYCFVENQLTIQSYSMHRCVHDWILARQVNAINNDDYWHAFYCITHYIPTRPMELMDRHLECMWLAPHAERLTLKHLLAACWSNMRPEDYRTRYDRLYHFLRSQDQLWACVNLLRYLHVVVEKESGSECVDAIDIAQRLSKIYKRLNLLDDAEHWIALALSNAERSLPPDGEITLETLGVYSKLCYVLDKLDEAESSCFRTVTCLEQKYGRGHSKTLPWVVHLGRIYRKQGRYEDAEREFLRHLTGCERVFGPTSSYTSYSHFNLGTVRADIGRFAEAESLIIRRVTHLQKNVGPDHATTLDATRKLGSVKSLNGDYDDAERVLRRTLSRLETTLGTTHFLTVKCVHALGEVYTTSGKPKEAEAYFIRVVKEWKNMQGLRYRYVAAALKSLVQLYYSEQRQKEAIYVLQNLLANQQRHCGHRHVHTIGTAKLLDGIYTDQGEVEAHNALCRQYEELSHSDL